MNRELLRLKRAVTKMTTPTREQEVCRALQTIFHDMEVGLTDKEAFNILGWEYETKEELFNIYDKDKITVTPYDKHESIIFNSDISKELDDIEGAIIFNLDVPE